MAQEDTEGCGVAGHPNETVSVRRLKNLLSWPYLTPVCPPLSKMHTLMRNCKLEGSSFKAQNCEFNIHTKSRALKCKAIHIAKRTPEISS